MICFTLIPPFLPGISPTACPFRPNPAISTSSFSSMKFKHPSLGTNAVIFLPFFISWTRIHFRMAELGCFASTPLCVYAKKRKRGGRMRKGGG